MRKPRWLWIFLNLVAIAALTLVGPAEKSLGVNVRVVYLHGAWVWAAMIAFVAAGLMGLIGVVTRRVDFQRWSRAIGRTGLLFWVTYLPISMWAMETNWNGLFLAEPRFRVAVIFAIGGFLLQVGVTIANDPAWASAVNVLFVSLLFVVLGNTQNVMHPPSPILDSNAVRIQIFFFSLLGLTLLLAAQIAIGWYQLERIQIASSTKSPVQVSQGD